MRKERFPTLDECETFHFGGECDVRILGRGFVMHNVSVRINCLKTYEQFFQISYILKTYFIKAQLSIW